MTCRHRSRWDTTARVLLVSGCYEGSDRDFGKLMASGRVRLKSAEVESSMSLVRRPHALKAPV